MLYMRTRVTFRLPSDLAEELRDLPNQTQFAEMALRDALGVACPACRGRGRVPGRAVAVPDFRASGLPPLSRGMALQLKELTSLGWEVSATEIELTPTPARDRLAYRLRRRGDVLLRGFLEDVDHQPRPN
jgi:hypothetical protein